MTDGYAAWRMLDGVTHLGCLAHARRRFDEALKAQKQPTGRAKQALEFIGKLYQIENKSRGKPPDGETLEGYAYRLRQEHSRPVLDAFYTWLVKNQAEVLPKSLIGKAIAYALGQWKYLIRYVDDGRAPIDNNLIERDIRPFTTGRKNWLFSDTVAGARASAIIYSIMLTCRACNVEPYAYLCHVLTELPQRRPDADIADLLPFNFRLKTPATGE
jgi:transposase